MSYQDKQISLMYYSSNYSGKTIQNSNYKNGYFDSIPIVLYQEKESELYVTLGSDVLTLYSKLKEIHSEIDRSKILSKRMDDWDENGAIGFIRENYYAAIKFLVMHANKIYIDHSIGIYPPEIVLARDGSIDLQWRSEKFILVINFRELGLYGDFYGEDYIKGTVIKGPIDDIEINDDLSHWMRKLK